MDMNTTAVQAALVAARGTTAELVAISQPAVPAGMKLLARGHEFRGVYLDLYGHADDVDGCTVEAVTLTGCLVDLSHSLLTMPQLTALAWRLDKAGLAARAAAAGEAKAEGVLLDRASD